MEKHDTLFTSDTHFDQLEKAMTEPVVKNVLDTARTFNTLLRDEATTLTEISTIIKELDALWSPLMGQMVKVSGMVTMANENGDIEPVFCDEQDFITNGFCVDNTEDEPLYGRKIMTQLLKPTQDNEGQYDVCAGDIDRTTIDFSVASFERATAWLGAFYPEVIDDIDSRLFNTDGTEADAVMALKDYVLPPFGEDEEFAHHCVGNYIKQVVQFDDSMPYEIMVDGNVVMTDDDGDDVIASVTSENMLAYVHSVLPGKQYDESGISGILSLSISIVHDDRLEPHIPMRVPLESVTNLASLRANFYASNRA